MNNIRLGDFDPIPIVQAKKKYANFTVREIGGPAEILIWRAEQAKKEAANLAAREAAKDLQKAFLAGNAPEGDGVTWKGSGSVSSGTPVWQDKLDRALSERKRLAKPELVRPEALVIAQALPAPTLFQRMKFWITAFFT